MQALFSSLSGLKVGSAASTALPGKSSRGPVLRPDFLETGLMRLTCKPMVHRDGLRLSHACNKVYRNTPQFLKITLKFFQFFPIEHRENRPALGIASGL